MDILSRKWLKRMMDLAYNVSSWSKDTSTKTGSVIVSYDGDPISWGFNGFPPLVNDDIPERMERPLKYKFIEHAERNAIYGATRTDLRSCVLFCTHYPCHDCARAIIRKKIKTVVIDKRHGRNGETGFNERWDDSFTDSEQMFKEAGVTVIEVDMESTNDF
jgi:dCMP deaminase